MGTWQFLWQVEASDDLLASVYLDVQYGDCAGNTIEENSSIFSLIRMY